MLVKVEGNQLKNKGEKTGNDLFILGEEVWPLNALTFLFKISGDGINM